MQRNLEAKKTDIMEIAVAQGYCVADLNAPMLFLRRLKNSELADVDEVIAARLCRKFKRPIVTVTRAGEIGNIMGRFEDLDRYLSEQGVKAYVQDLIKPVLQTAALSEAAKQAFSEADGGEPEPEIPLENRMVTIPAFNVKGATVRAFAATMAGRT